MQQTRSFSRIVGTGGYLPGSPVSNDDLVKRLKDYGTESSDEWIRERTGITSRYFSDGITTCEMGFHAAGTAISNAGIQAKDIDLIIVATTTPDKIFPSVACHIEKELGLDKCTSFDLQAVCSGFVYGLTVADLFLRTGSRNCALVIGTETLSSILDWKDRTTCVLFGDGAGAVILKRDQKPGIIDSEIFSSGKHSNILFATGRPNQGSIDGTGFAEMNGQEVFKQAVSALAKSGKSIMSKNLIDSEAIDWYIPHQANVRIINKVAERLEIPETKVIKYVDIHANTSAASVPLALNEAVENGKVCNGNKLLLQGVGGGLTWGSILVDF